MADRRQQLIELLLHSPAPMTGEDLAARFGVSDRSIRTWIRDINRRHPIVRSTNRGYSIDPGDYGRSPRPAPAAPIVDTPDRRLHYLCRELAKRTDDIDIHDLAETLHVSESTIETDLVRARELFRQHDLVLTRDHEQLRLTGSERARRRLIRQLLHASSGGLAPAAWRAFINDSHDIDVKALKTTVGEPLKQAGVTLNEYALNDLVVHLTVAIERTRIGSPLPDTNWEPPADDPRVVSAAQAITSTVSDTLGVRLPPSEVEALYSMLAVRAVRNDLDDSGKRVVDPAIRDLVADLLTETSGRYLLGPAPPTSSLNLALHVQNLIKRARAGQPLRNPLGEQFRTDHPLIHDLAVYFAGRLEEALGIHADLGEIDYLSFHLGMYFLQQLDQQDAVTITVVTPAYYELADTVAAKLRDALGSQAVVEQTLTSLDVAFDAITSDLVVSSIEPSAPAAAPVIRISPLLTSTDLDLVLAAVRHERQRIARRRVQLALSTLIEPSLFVRVKGVTSRDDALQLMTDRLVARGYVQPTFIHDVLDRENRSPTAFGTGFAIPHSMYLDANATAISVLIADEPIPWGDSAVRLILLFALNEDGRRTFRDILDQIPPILSASQSTTALSQSRTFGEFMAALEGMLLQP